MVLNSRNYRLEKTFTSKGIRLLFAGRITVEDADELLEELYEILSGHKGIVTVDLSSIEYMDSAAVLTLYRFEEKLRRDGGDIYYEKVPPSIDDIMKIVPKEAVGKPLKPPFFSGIGFVESVGLSVISLLGDCRSMLTFLGLLLEASFSLLRQPYDIRWLDVLAAVRRIGAQGLPIVGLISFLIGLIIAFMSSLQLKQFGANIFVASLVSVALVRELGPIMTAILVAGRSASAFAAEIGTMRINEEIDALIVMGFDPIKFLAVPKLIAVFIVMPLLTIYADLFGIIGGLVVGITGLDLTTATYLEATRRSVDVFMLFSSMVKAVFFSFVIAWIGCHRGFQVSNNVQEVGEATTSAVVTSILFIVIIDSVFAVVLHYL